MHTSWRHSHSLHVSTAVVACQSSSNAPRTSGGTLPPASSLKSLPGRSPVVFDTRSRRVEKVRFPPSAANLILAVRLPKSSATQWGTG